MNSIIYVDGRKRDYFQIKDFILNYSKPFSYNELLELLKGFPKATIKNVINQMLENGDITFFGGEYRIKVEKI